MTQPDEGEGPEVELNEQASPSEDQDQRFDTLEDALDALDDFDPAEGQPEGDEPDEEPETDDEVVVELDDGTTATLAELKEAKIKEKLQQADYTKKTTEAAELRKAAEAYQGQLAQQATMLRTAMHNLATYIEGAIPPEPPMQLAYTDPGQHHLLKVQRETALREVQQLISNRDAVDGLMNQMSEAERQAYAQQEQIALVRALPDLADPVKRAAFDQANRTFAKSMGFADEEIDTAYDHRLQRLTYLARIGQKALQNKSNATRRKVEAPRVQTTSRTPVSVSTTSRDQQKQMRRLSQTGAFKDALKLDF